MSRRASRGPVELLSRNFIELHRGFLLNEIVANGFTTDVWPPFSGPATCSLMPRESTTDTIEGSIHDVSASRTLWV